MVDDLNHLVKGGRLSNGAAISWNLLSIKLFFILMMKAWLSLWESPDGKESHETVRLLYQISQMVVQVFVIHANVPEKAEALPA